jgi:ribosomal protein S18 acetylase RimI-like enzyme
VPALQMVWNGEAPAGDPSLGAVSLGAPHVDAMLELVALTQPGPFGPRNLDMGEYLGLFDERGRLVAMAGERMWAGRFREISAVCTHPESQGRGLARRLMHELIRRQSTRGLVPFLHVMAFNERAISLYRHMGFHARRESLLRVVCRE